MAGALRTVAYNVFGCTGYPPEAAREALGEDVRAQVAARIAAALATLESDIVTLCECPDEETIRAIADDLGMDCVRFPGPQLWPGTLLTRLEIVDAENCPYPGGARPEELFTRHWGRALLRQPDGTELVVHSAHLHPRDERRRKREVAAVLRSLRADLDAARPVLLQGDLNHTPQGPEHERWLRAGLIDTFERAGDGDGYTFRSGLPVARIDYVFAGGPLGATIEQSGPVAEPPFTSLPGQCSFALSDHLPLVATFAS